MNKITVFDIMQALKDRKDRSAFSRGVTLYALELLEQAAENANYHGSSVDISRVHLLNGAASWAAYSYGGCALIYDEDIAARLCTPSELKRKKGGELAPNRRESWLDVQARALVRAAARLQSVAVGLGVDSLTDIAA